VTGEDAATRRARDVRSVFFVARSTNKNQVHYGVRVDAACNPIGAEPVYGYWQMLESRGEIEPILALETPAYGLQESQSIRKSGSTTTIRVKLRAFPERPLDIAVVKGRAGCEAVATTTIAGSEAQIAFIYVKLRWPFGIEYVLLRGWGRTEGRAVEEVIRN